MFPLSVSLSFFYLLTVHSLQGPASKRRLEPHEDDGWRRHSPGPSASRQSYNLLRDDHRCGYDDPRYSPRRSDYHQPNIPSRDDDRHRCDYPCRSPERSGHRQIEIPYRDEDRRRYKDSRWFPERPNYRQSQASKPDKPSTLLQGKSATSTLSQHAASH